ncbi:MAG: 1-acyl-sn-glycerol-3-phosphate acyltransferase [Acidimicrobiales bacterium]
MIRRTLDRILWWLCRVLTAGYFREVEVADRHRVPPAGTPCLVVANHFNGFVDPVLVVRGIGRVPRFLAKATLWEIRIARPLYAFAGMIPVHRKADGAAGDANTSTFRSAHVALHAGATVAIFPEGTTHDEPRLAQMRTGAARIALGAVADGVRDLTILPVGLVVEDKLETRPRALVQVGDPIVVASQVGGSRGEEDHDAVRRLTDAIADRLRAVTPDFDSSRDHGTLSLAAEIVARRPGSDATGEVGLAERERLAKELGRLPESARTSVRAAVADYQLDLALLGLRDSELVAGLDRTQVLRRLVRSAVILVVFAPLAFVGVVTNLVPGGVVVAAGRRAAAPVSKGTVRMLTALVVFPLTWWAVAATLVDGWVRVAGVMAALAVCGLVAAAASEVLSDAVRDHRGWRAVVDRRTLLGPVRDHRDRLVAGIDALVAAGHPHDAADR